MDNSPKSLRNIKKIKNHYQLSARKALDPSNIHLKSPIKDSGQNQINFKIIACNMLGINLDKLNLKYNNNIMI